VIEGPALGFDRQHERWARDARRGKLGRGRYRALVEQLVTVTHMAFEAGAIGSLWGLEGPMRAGIREDLCRQAWGWSAADLMARDLLANAFRVLEGRFEAERPEWNEGQPEWVVHEGLLIERTRCINCHCQLPEGHHKYCSRLCAGATQQRHYRRLVAGEGLAIKLAIDSI